MMDLGKENSKQTKGLENLEFLTDKATRLVFMLEAEERKLSQLHDELKQIRRQKKELTEINRGLKKKLTTLEEDRGKVDEKAESILSAIGELAID